MKLRIRLRSAKHREEAVKLAAVMVNGAAIACLIGSSFGPWLNPALNWGWTNLVLLLAAVLLHFFAQLVLSFAFDEDKEWRSTHLSAS